MTMTMIGAFAAVPVLSPDHGEMGRRKQFCARMFDGAPLIGVALAAKHTCCPRPSPTDNQDDRQPCDSPCCVTTCSQLVLGALVIADYGFLVDVTWMRSPVTNLSHDHVWRDPLLRPPIA